VIIRNGLLIPPRGRQAGFKVDNIMLEILFSLFEIDPHYEKEIARRVGVDIMTVRRRINQLRESGLLISARPNIAKLKLRGVAVVARFTNTISEGARLNLLKISPYWRYINRGYESNGKVYLANYAIPISYVDNLKSYLENLKREGIITSYRIYDFVNTIYNRFSLEYYDYSRRKWNVNPMDWARDIITSPVLKIPEVFDERVYYEGTYIDKIDLIIMEDLEVQGLKPLYSFATELGITPQQVYCHYANHIQKQKLILQYVPLLYTVSPNLAFKITLILEASKEEILGKIIDASQGRPFLVSYSVNPYTNTIVLCLSLTRTTLTLLYNAIDYLNEIGLIKSYRVILLDDLIIGQSIPYARAYDFNNYRWSPPRFPKVDEVLKIWHRGLK